MRERGSPFAVRPAVDAVARGLRVDVEDVVAFLRLVRWACVAALAPRLCGCEGAVGCERIARDAPQEVHLLLLGALQILDAGSEVLELARVSRLADFLRDAPFVARLLVRI